MAFNMKSNLGTIKQIDTWTPGAGAVVKDFSLPQGAISACILQWDMLGSGAAATVANALTQCGTLVYLKDGAGDVTPEWTAAQLYEYHNQFFDRICPFQDGTAADNKLALFQQIIPMGRPLQRGTSSLFGLIDPYVGWNPKGTPQLHIDIPADGNSIDGRHLKIVVVYANKPFKYGKRWTTWASQTLSTTGYTDWIIADKGLLLEMFAYATSAYNDTLTADAPTLLKAKFERASKDVIFDGEIPNIFGCLQDVTPTPDDDFLYFSLSQGYDDDFSNCVNMNGAETKFRAYGGVADAFIATFSYLL